MASDQKTVKSHRGLSSKSFQLQPEKELCIELPGIGKDLQTGSYLERILWADFRLFGILFMTKVVKASESFIGLILPIDPSRSPTLLYVII